MDNSSYTDSTKIRSYELLLYQLVDKTMNYFQHQISTNEKKWTPEKEENSRERLKKTLKGKVKEHELIKKGIDFDSLMKYVNAQLDKFKIH